MLTSASNDFSYPWPETAGSHRMDHVVWCSAGIRFAWCGVVWASELVSFHPILTLSKGFPNFIYTIIANLCYLCVKAKYMLAMHAQKQSCQTLHQVRRPIKVYVDRMTKKKHMRPDNRERCMWGWILTKRGSLCWTGYPLEAYVGLDGWISMLKRGACMMNII
jgi:hypothetical protein